MTIELDEVRAEILVLKLALDEERAKRQDLENYIRKELIDLRKELEKERIHREILSSSPVSTSPLNSPSTHPSSSSSFDVKTRRGTGVPHQLAGSSSRSRDKQTVKDKSKKDKHDKDNILSNSMPSSSKPTEEDVKDKKVCVSIEVSTSKEQLPYSLNQSQSVEFTKLYQPEDSSVDVTENVGHEDPEKLGHKKSKSLISLPIIHQKKSSGGFFNRMKKGGSKVTVSVDVKGTQDFEDEVFEAEILPSPSDPTIAPPSRRKFLSLPFNPLVEPSKKQLIEKGVFIDGDSSGIIPNAAVKVPCEGYWIELGTPSSLFVQNNWQNFLRLESEYEYEEPFYRLPQKDKYKLSTYLGEENGPVITSFKTVTGTQEEDNHPVSAIVHTRTGSKRYLIEGSRNKKKKLAKQVPLPAKMTKVKDARLIRDLTNFEDNSILSHRLYKFGILYSTDDQTEDQSYCNEKGSADFDEFLEFIGRSIYLKGCTVFSGGLDTKSDSTGYKSVYTSFQSTEIMFHVSTLLPYTQNDAQQLERKRHLGNDIVVIVFLDGNQPWSPQTFCSHFNHIFCVVRKEKQPLSQLPTKVPRRSAIAQFTPRLHLAALRSSTPEKKKNPLIGKVSQRGSGGSTLSLLLPTSDKLRQLGSDGVQISPTSPNSQTAPPPDLSPILYYSTSPPPPPPPPPPHRTQPSILSPPGSARGLPSISIDRSSPQLYSPPLMMSPPSEAPIFESGPISPVSDETDSTQDQSIEESTNDLDLNSHDDTPPYNPDSTYYRVSIVSKKIVGSFGPYITDSGIYEKGPALRDFLLSKLINGERSALRVPEFDNIISRTRSLQLHDLIKTYAPTN
eukprot:TRINITY_DN5669_c0_g1_i1.p1 TRINITY_DN5669_c0_g1~~TRINITY_DN5669_c0_g1_i1.p1  ORF type:complete len:839 (-),score=182.09 TRINITY_DN5669_c0_g1_i1:113-2629(-)